MAGLGKQTRGNGIARVMKSKGGYMDMSEKHEGWNLKLKKLKNMLWKQKDTKKLNQVK
jgi:hypothetical protein